MPTSNPNTDGQSDAEATVKFAILDAIASTHGPGGPAPPEAARDAIYEAVLADDVRWALEELICNE